MSRARTLAAAVAMALLAGPTHAQSELAPDQTLTPAERPTGAIAPTSAPEPLDAPALPEGAAAPDKPAPVPEPKPKEPESAGEDAARERPWADTQAPADGGAPAEAPAPQKPTEAPATAPLPAEDPEVGAEAPERAPAPDEPPVPEQLAEDGAALAACLGRLRGRGTVFERVEPISERDGDCGIANPLRVTEIVPGVALEPAGVMRCAAAATLADWVATFVLPAGAMLPERGRLTALEHGTSYLCRGVGGGETLSEHAFGNAIDVMAFRFADGPPIPVEPRAREGSTAAAFQRTARASACLGFTTVLGPGEPEHDDHLHLDIAERGSGYRLCR